MTKMAEKNNSSLRLASAPLEILAIQEEDGIPLHVIPSNHPSIDDEYTQMALSSSCYNDELFVLATTPFTASYIVELRTFFIHSSSVNAAPHHIQFPAPILPGLRIISVDEQSIILQACTVTGYLYRIYLPLHLLHSTNDIPTRWIAEQRLVNVSNDVKTNLRENVLISTHISEDGQISLISCTDGKVIKAVWDQQDDNESELHGRWQESALRPTTFFGRLFGRGGSSVASPRVSSMTTYPRSTSWTSFLAFTTSQDRRMRIWDLGSDACIRNIDLPRLSKEGSILKDGEHGLVESNSEDDIQDDSSTMTGRPAIVRTISTAHHDSSSPYALYVIVSVPGMGSSKAFLACYGVQLDEISSSSSRHYNGSVGDIDLVWTKRFENDVSGLDVELRDISIEVDGAYWKIWCVWDAAGKVSVRTLHVDGSPSQSAVDSSHWQTVSLPVSFSPLSGAALDQDLEALDDASDLGAFFIQRIVEPGRFSMNSMEEAIKSYENGLLAKKVDPALLPVTSSAQSSIRERVLGLVGCTVQLRHDEATGAPAYDEHFAEIKREWMIFVSLLNQADTLERWPIAFAGGRKVNSSLSTYPPFISSRGWLSLPVKEDEASHLLRCIKMGDYDYDENRSNSLLEFAQNLRENIQPRALREFEVALDEVLSTQPSIVIEDAVDALWTVHLVDALSVDEEELKDGFASLEMDLPDSISRILAILRGRSSENTSLVGKTAGQNNTELTVAFTADALTQIVSDRLSLAKTLLIVVLFVHSGLFDNEERAFNDESLSEMFRQLVVVIHKLSALDLAARIDGIGEIASNEPKLEDDVNDADNVAKKIGQLQFASGQEDSPAFSDAAASNLVHKALLRGFLGGDSKLRTPSIVAGITDRASDAIKALLFSGENEDVVEIDASFTLFANASLVNGHLLAAIELVKKFPPSIAGHYIVGRSLIALGETDEAAIAFEKVLGAFEHWSDEQSILGTGLQQILPVQIGEAETANEAAFLYCRLVVSFFKLARSLPHIAHFATLALTYADDASATEKKYKTRELHLALFRSFVEMERFDDAYGHILSNPFDDLQRESLRTLISIMCEQGRVEELLTFNFAGLQAEVERTLSFKARNSDPLHEEMNYYDVLYAFHIRRGDLKSAGATMWQMGMRIRDIYRKKIVQNRRLQMNSAFEDKDQIELRRFAILEARSYLASINVLSLIEEKDAWFAHELAEGDEDALAIAESGRLTSFLPTSSFQSKKREIRIIHIEDVRRRYQLLLAQLELVSLYPKEATAIMSSNSSDAITAVLLFVREQDFDHAFLLARSAKVDKAQIYVSLTDRCLELARWDEQRRKREMASQGGQEEHPLMRALFDDQDMSDFSLANIGLNNGSMDDEQNAPLARFLDRSDRCASWKGSPGKRAWRYLKLWLDMESEAEGRYFICILKRILERNLWQFTPEWLLNWLRENEADSLIRTMMDHDLISFALEEATRLVKLSTKYVSDSVKRRKIGEPIASRTYLPYLLFDELLKRAEESPISNGHPSLNEQRQKAKALQDTIESHKEQLKRLELDLRRNLDEDEARQRKLTAAALVQKQQGSRTHLRRADGGAGGGDVGEDTDMRD